MSLRSRTRTPPQFRADDPKIIAHVAARLDHARRDAMWFAIGTVFFTPIAIVLAGVVLAVCVELLGLQPTIHRYDYRWDSVTGVVIPNLVVCGLLLTAASRSWRSRWTWGGFCVFGLGLALSFGTSMYDEAGFVFWLLWGLLSIAALTLVSQAGEATGETSSNPLAILPNAVIAAHRTLLRDLWFRDRGGEDVARAVAMLQAVASGDRKRQYRLIDSASARGVDLKARLTSAGLIRTHNDKLRLGDHAPEPSS